MVRPVGTGMGRFFFGAGGMLIAATLWGVFAVPNDPSRSGNAPFPVRGIVRLGLELVILFGGALGFLVTGNTRAAIVIAVLVAVHYALWPARILWLLAR